MLLAPINGFCYCYKFFRLRIVQMSLILPRDACIDKATREVSATRLLWRNPCTFHLAWVWSWALFLVDRKQIWRMHRLCFCLSVATTRKWLKYRPDGVQASIATRHWQSRIDKLFWPLMESRHCLANPIIWILDLGDPRQVHVNHQRLLNQLLHSWHFLFKTVDTSENTGPANNFKFCILHVRRV